MEKICDLKNRISVLRALLQEQEDKLKVLEAIEKEKEELWLRECAPLSPDCSPAKNQREDCAIPYIVDYTLRNHHILRPTRYWLTLNNSCQKTGI